MTGGRLYDGARHPRSASSSPCPGRHHAADEPEPGVPRREPQRHERPGRARPCAALLVASQVAFAFMLLVGAGLLFASFQRVLAFILDSSRRTS